MGVTVKTDLKPTRQQLKTGVTRARQLVASQIHADSNRYAPFQYGDMRNQSTIAIGGEKIIWNAFYSIYQYSKQYQNYTTPNTGPHWDQVAAQKHMKSWERVAKRAFT